MPRHAEDWLTSAREEEEEVMAVIEQQQQEGEEMGTAPQAPLPPPCSTLSSRPGPPFHGIALPPPRRRCGIVSTARFGPSGSL
eukprot:6722388-Prorocentrum_lima.AAC.1